MNKPVSAANIAVDGLSSLLPTTASKLDNNATEEEVAACFRRLRKLNRSFPATVKRNDRVHVLIAACLAEGLNTRGRIRGAIASLGYDPAHVVIVLGSGSGTTAEHWWRPTADGTYILNNDGPLQQRSGSEGS